LGAGVRWRRLPVVFLDRKADGTGLPLSMPSGQHQQPAAFKAASTG